MPTLKSFLLHHFKATIKLSQEQRLALLETLSPLIDIDRPASAEAIKDLRDDKQLNLTEEERILLNMAYWQTVSPEVAAPSNARPHSPPRRRHKRGSSGMWGHSRMESMGLYGRYPGGMGSMYDMYDREAFDDHNREMRHMNRRARRHPAMDDKLDILRRMGIRNQRDLITSMAFLPPEVQEELKELLGDDHEGFEMIRASARDYAAAVESTFTSWKESKEDNSGPSNKKEEKQD